jgi:AsmA protein
LVQGTLAFSSLDVSPYWEAFLASLRRAGAWFTAPIELAPLHLADVDLRLSSPQLVVGDTTLRDVAATLVSNQGRIAVNVGRAELFGGSLKASLNGEFRHDRLYFRGQGRIAGMPAAPAGRAIAGFAVLEGPADLAVDVTGAGRSWGELVGELSGRLELAVAAGRLNGIDLPRFAARVAASPDEETEPDRSGSTAFSRLSATASLDGGLLVSDDIVIDGDAYAVRLKGSSLAGAAISGTGEIVLKAAEGPAIPLLVGGTWSAPTITVDRDRFDLGRVGEPG